MARPHSLMVWSVVFAFLAAASLCAAEAKEPKEPKQKHAKASAAKATPRRSDDPFAGLRAQLETLRRRNRRRIVPMILSRGPKNSPRRRRRSAKTGCQSMRPGENVARIEAALASPTEVVLCRNAAARSDRLPEGATPYRDTDRHQGVRGRGNRNRFAGHRRPEGDFAPLGVNLCCGNSASRG